MFLLGKILQEKEKGYTSHFDDVETDEVIDLCAQELRQNDDDDDQSIMSVHSEDEVKVLESVEGDTDDESSSCGTEDSMLQQVTDVALIDDVQSELDDIASHRKSWLAVGSSGAGWKATEKVPLIRVSNDDLQEAALRCDLGLVRRLIAEGASVNAPMRPECDDEFITLLHILASKPEMPNGTRMMAEVCRKKANLNPRSSLGATPLMWACLYKNIGAVEVLLQESADLNAIDDWGRTCVHCAVATKVDTRQLSTSLGVEVLQLLHGAKANLNYCDIGADARPAPIVDAIDQLNAEAVDALVDMGAKAAGLHLAVRIAPVPILKTLVRAQANPFTKDESTGETILDIAFSRGDEPITTLMRNFMGDLQRMQHPHAKDVDIALVSQEEPHPHRETNKKGVVQTVAEVVYTWQWALVMKYALVVHVHAVKYQSNQNFSAASFFFLIAALFLPDIWIFADAASQVALDWILVVIILFFSVEMFLTIAAQWKKYLQTWTFWLDLASLFSVFMDHSAISGLLPEGALTSTTVSRIARVAKIAARAGRLAKLGKLLRYLPGGQSTEDETKAKAIGVVITSKLNGEVAIKVALLIICIIIFAPWFELFNYPLQDYSMLAWTDELGDVTSRGDSTEVSAFITTLTDFYSGLAYFPYRVEYRLGDSLLVTEKWLKKEPARKQNRAKVNSEIGSATIHFDFTETAQTESVCNIALIVFVVIVMILSSMAMSQAIGRIVLTPLETLLNKIKKTATKIFNTVSSVAAKLDVVEKMFEEAQASNPDPDGGAVDETMVLEKLLTKIQTLSSITVKTNPLEDSNSKLHSKDEAILELCKTHRASDTTLEEHEEDSEEGDDPHMLVLVERLEAVLRDGRLTWAAIMHVDMDALAMEWRQLHAISVCCLLFHRGVSETSLAPVENTFRKFVDAISTLHSSSLEAPFHSFYRAADVVAETHRLLIICCSELYFTFIDRFGLIVSALAHDVCHPGVNNMHLIQERHPLALMYNDRSPLENMQCSKLWALVGNPELNIFNELDQSQYREIREVCIQAILATDPVHIFFKLKDIRMVHDHDVALYDANWEFYKDDQYAWPATEVVEVFREIETKKQLRNMFLYLADNGHSARVFDVSYKWATLMIEEFHRQGDLDLSQNLPCPPLYNREVTGIYQANVVLIEFMCIPMFLAVAKIMPPVTGHLRNLMHNYREWISRWIESDPDLHDVELPQGQKSLKPGQRTQMLGFTFGSGRNSASRANLGEGSKSWTFWMPSIRGKLQRLMSVKSLPVELSMAEKLEKRATKLDNDLARYIIVPT